MLPFSGNLSSERCKVKHFTEYGFERFRFLRIKKLDLINEERLDRLFSTVCVFLEHTGQTDQRSLVLDPSLRVQLEVRNIVQIAKGSKTVFLLRGIAFFLEKVDNIVSYKFVATCASV